MHQHLHHPPMPSSCWGLPSFWKCIETSSMASDTNYIDSIRWPPNPTVEYWDVWPESETIQALIPLFWVLLREYDPLWHKNKSCQENVMRKWRKMEEGRTNRTDNPTDCVGLGDMLLRDVHPRISSTECCPSFWPAHGPKTPLQMSFSCHMSRMWSSAWWSIHSSFCPEMFWRTKEQTPASCCCKWFDQKFQLHKMVKTNILSRLVTFDGVQIGFPSFLEGTCLIEIFLQPI